MKTAKKNVKNIFEFLIDILIYFVFLWAGILAITFTFDLPLQGLKVLVCSVMMVTIPKMITRFKNKKEE